MYQISYSNNKRKQYRYNQKLPELESAKVRNNLLRVPNRIYMQGPKVIAISDDMKGKAEISFLNTLCIRTFSDSFLRQPDHTPSSPATILCLNTTILQGRVLQAVPLPSHSTGIEKANSFSVFPSRLVRIGTCRRLIGQGTRPQN